MEKDKEKVHDKRVSLRFLTCPGICSRVLSHGHCPHE